MEKPTKKRKLNFTEDACCFCNKSFNNNKVFNLLDPGKSALLLSVCVDRTDNLSLNIIENEVEIKNGEIKIAYHKKCRTLFVYSNKCSNDSEEDKVEQSVAVTSSKLLRSSSNEEFKWTEKCFICGEQCSNKHRKTWSQVEGSVDATSEIYNRLLNISSAIGDDILHTRILSSKGDLVAVEARYHRKKGCLAKYLLKEANIKPDLTSDKADNHFNLALDELKCELYDEVEVNKSVYELSSLKEKIQQISKSKQLTLTPNKLTGTEIKKGLKRVWPKLKFVSRTGRCDLVYSESLTLDEALCKGAQSRNELELAEAEHDLDNSLCESFQKSEEHELSVLHKAAIILRKRLRQAKSLPNEYFAPSEIVIAAQIQFLDPHVLKFAKFLSGDTDDVNNNDTTVEQRVVTLCSDMTYLVKPVMTPKQLGLSV